MKLTEEFNKKSQIFYQNQNKLIKKLFTHSKDDSKFLKHLNLDFNPNNYKYKELVSTDIKDKSYLLQQEYIKRNIPFSPLLIHIPEEVFKKEVSKKQEEEFQYYKRHVYLENYDEEPEEEGVIINRINELKEKNNGHAYALTNWFDSKGNLKTKECEVLDYDPKEKLFNIKILLEKEIKGLEKKTEIIEIFKKVTRFNCLLNNESEYNLNRRKNLAKFWNYYATKYMALYNFVSESKILNPYNFFNKNYLYQILYYSFFYKGKNKHQNTVVEIENMSNSERFGIWRRYTTPRNINEDFFENKNFQKLFTIYNSNQIFNFIPEISENNIRAYQIHKFYKSLPFNYKYYDLLNEIIPLKKFLTPSEQFLLPEKEKGEISFKRKKSFLDIYTKMQYKLHQNEDDLSSLLINVKTHQEKSRNKLIFHQSFLTKPVTLENFRLKNSNTAKDIIKDINFIVSHSKIDLSGYLEMRKKEAEKVNKEAGIPEHLKHKFKKFENLINRVISHGARDTFHRSMEYIINVLNEITQKVIEEHENLNLKKFANANEKLREFINEIKIKRKKEEENKNEEENENKKKKNFEENVIFSEEEQNNINKLEEEIPSVPMKLIFNLRDDYPLEFLFQTEFNLMQFEFELKYNGKNFLLDPDFETFWSVLENHIRGTLEDFKTIKAVEIFDIEKENDNEKCLDIFCADDLSYELEISKLKSALELFFSPGEILLRYLNKEIIPTLIDLIKFSSGKSMEEENLNIKIFRHYIDENKKLFEFFNKIFKYDYFFLGGLYIKVKSMKEFWIKRLGDIKEKLFKLIMTNNVYLSDKMEMEKKEIENKLDEKPTTVDEYNDDIKYCANLGVKMKGIWEKINNQQENAELLEDNFNEIKREDFFRMWNCYGIPKYLQIKKEETDARLEADRKVFKKEVKQKYRDYIIKISELRQDFETKSIIKEIDTYEESFKNFSSLKYDIEKMIKDCKILNDHEAILRMKTSDLTEIREIRGNFDPYYSLWESVSNFLSGQKSWMEDNLKQIDRKKLKNTFEKCVSTIDNLEKTIFRKDKPAPNTVIHLLREKIEEFEPILPVLYDLINPDFKANHISDLSKAIGIYIPENLEINMNELIKNGILEKRDEISDRSVYATGQKKLNATLDKLKEKYKMMKFDVQNFNDTDLVILKDVEPLSEEIDVILTKIVSMSSSKFAKYLQKDIHFIWGNISKAQDIIDAWLKTQKLLTQLHQIFSYGDLKKQLSEEYPKYQNVEKQWRQIMEQVKGSPQLSEVVQMTKIKENFMKWASVLEDVNQSLNQYLNMKRDVFPRFYFVSNEELTLMLAQSGDPEIIASRYIQQVFEGMKKLDLVTNDVEVLSTNYETGQEEKKIYNLKKITHFVSEKGEKVKFLQEINPNEEIKNKEEVYYRTVLLEKWLTDVEFSMKLTLKNLFKDCYFDLVKPKDNKSPLRIDWAARHIEQAVLCISQLDWTERVNNAIVNMKSNKNSLKELYQHDNNQLLGLIQGIRNSENFNAVFKKTLVSLIIQDVHANDVIDYLIKNDVNTITAFEWISQLRYFFVNNKGKQISDLKEIDTVHVRMLNTERAYDFEYLGNQKRLVITPLTDRCYRTMMEALSNNLGGAPEGPAGTGKTETIKDLSKNLGKKCFTYNCSEDSDYTLMTKFFKGIAMSGSWVCFDEFNRITLDVLSVIAHQISILLTCLKGRTTLCNFDGRNFNFNFNMGIFITMNPNYAGRSELPDNLKGLFRPLAMMIPNYEMITEIMLYSFGFKTARDLSKKIVSSLRLASEQLSSQFHYDYGMRALNGIINYIGVITTENKIENEEQEEFLVQKAIRDSNMPKFIADDYKIYEGILSDLFPKEKFENKNDEKLLECIKNEASNLNLIPNNFLITKVIDFINIMSVRHAVMIVGAPMSNKSSILKVYLSSLPIYYKSQNLQKSVKCKFINPKSITGPQLFGFVNKKTMEFNEGICSKTLRSYFDDTSEDTKLLTFDGPVDTLWIENMNSVLDDTKKLCLENSDQIRLDEKTFIIFEIDDLSQASLATISRCGMVYTDRVNIDYEDFFESWIATLPESFRQNDFVELVKELFNKYYVRIINECVFDEYNNLKIKIGIPVFKNWFMKIFICVFECVLFEKISKEETIENELEKKRMKENNENEGINQEKDKNVNLVVHKNLSGREREKLFKKFIYSLIINFIWILENPKESQIIIDKIISINKENMKNQNFPFSEELMEFTKDYEQKIYQFHHFIFDFNENQFININEILKSSHDETFKLLQNEIAKGNNIMIPNQQSIKSLSLIKISQPNKFPLLLFGNTATGKSLMINNYIENELDKKWLNYTFIFNSKTTANNICDLLEEKISFKLKKGIMAPQSNKNAYILIEDLNMPSKEKYGAQPPIEILRQFFDYGGWYDRKEQDFIQYKNILINSCMTLGRPIVSLRLLWHFIPLFYPEIEENNLKEIFKEYFEVFFFKYPNPIRKLRDTIVEGAISSYRNVKNTFRPLPVTPHYNFNLRDLIKVFKGLFSITLESLRFKEDTTDYMMTALMHETCRVYNDRLCSEEHRMKFKDEILYKLQDYAYHGIDKKDSDMQYNNLFFSEINEDKFYERVEDIEQLRSFIYSRIESYNLNKKTKDRIDIILFDYSMKHLLRIDRILSREGEHSVLIGLTGSGRQSLVNICSFIKSFKIFKTRGKDEVEDYSHKDWLKDIQELYLQAGLRLEQTVFLLNDNNINDEQMFVDLNCIISSGVVYNLFTNDEKMETIANLKQVKEYEEYSNLDDQVIWDHFIVKTLQRCRVFLCMNPLGKNFTKVLRNFPALTFTSMDWYEQWPEDALYYLAKKELTKEKTLKKDVENLAYIFSKTFVSINKENENYFNQTRKKVIILPKSFLDFLAFYKELNVKYSEKIINDIKKYKDGVKRIDEAGEQIKIMGELLEKKKPLLIEQGKVIEKTLKDIKAQSEDAEVAKAQTAENEKIAIEKQIESDKQKADAEVSKEEAEKIKNEINIKIKQIDKKQFSALRSYSKPPKEINKMMAAITVILNNFEKKQLDTVPDNWAYFKKILNDVKLLKTLLDLPRKLEKNLFSPKILTLLQPFIEDPDLEPSYMEKKISSACGCFCHFIMGMFKLNELLRDKLIPATNRLNLALEESKKASENLHKIQTKFNEIQNKLDELTNNYNKINNEQEILQAEIAESQKKLTRAQKLTSKLGGEKKRWSECAVELEEKKQFVFGDIILSAIYISFLGPFLVPFRNQFLTKIIFKFLEEKNIKFSGVPEINKIIGDPYLISNWVINGLPPDNGSVDNGMILNETKKPCLIIDPQKQAIKFFNKLYKNDFVIYKKIEINTRKIKLDQHKETLLENAIKTGKCLIFDYISYDIQSDAELLLNSEIVHRSEGDFLKLTESNEIPYNSNFKYYLVSYLTNPVFNPELYGRISIINFTVNTEGLTEQLLSVIVKEESPADESEKNNILQKKFQLNETVHKTEEDILQKLSVSSEELLESDGLIFSLEESKKLSDEANQQIRNAKITEERIDNNRMLYLPLAKLSTMIFFAINELNNLEEIYQFSISWYIKDILVNSIKQNDYDKNAVTIKTKEFILERLKILTESLLKTSYVAVCRSLLNKDKLVFSMILLLRKLIDDGEITKDESEFFLGNDDFIVMKEENEKLKEKKQDLFERNVWEKLCVCNNLENMQNICEEIINNLEDWRNFINNVINNSEIEYEQHFNFPLKEAENVDENETENAKKLSLFHKLIFLKIINPEYLLPYSRIVISKYLGPELSNIPLFTIEDLYEISSFNTPLMLIVAAGLDPTNDVKKLAEDNNKDLVSVSLGQGQSEKALASIEECQKKGQWVFLQNLHLVTGFMKNLEGVISVLQNNDREMNIGFRLWLSSLPADNILSSILVNSLKITVESPTGMKSNLLKLLKQQEKGWQYEHEQATRFGKEFEFTKLFIGLIHFHSILLERKNYGPIGWNIKYNFNESDFQISKLILKSNLEKYSSAGEAIPFKAIIYLTADCIYGGRVTDDWDRRTLYAILNDLYNQKILNENEFKINDTDFVIDYHENYEPYFNRFNSLPENESPEVLGLHQNTLLRKQKDEGKSLLMSLNALQKGNESGNIQIKLKMLENVQNLIKEKIIPEFNIDEIKKKFPLIYEDCFNSILIQEVMRYNNLLKIIFSTLNDCVNAFKGLLPLTDEIEEVVNEIIQDKTPEIWIKSSYPSKKPIKSWILDLHERIEFFQNWIENGTPLKFWFSAFFFTQSFLTGIKQNFARKNKESIDRLEFDFGFVDEENFDMSRVEKREEYYIYGVYIEGAEWNKETHTIDELKGKNVDKEMPPILLRVRVFDKDNNDKSKFFYEAPVYKCSSRQGSLSTTGHSTNYIFTVNLPSLVEPNHWIKRGVALLNQLDD